MGHEIERSYFGAKLFIIYLFILKVRIREQSYTHSVTP